MFKSMRCPAIDRWRFSPNRESFEADAIPSRLFFQQMYSNLGVLPVVHFIANQKQWKFTFHHYLVVLSTIRFLQPQAVFIHLIKEPEIDHHHYLEWWNDILDTVPNLILKSVAGMSPQRILQDYGGIIIPWSMMTLELESMSSSQGEFSCYPGFKASALSFMSHVRSDICHINCLHVRFDREQRVVLPEELEKPATCAIFDDFKEEAGREDGRLSIHPYDIMTGSHWFSKNARALFYASSDEIVTRKNSDSLVPLICHYAIMGGVALPVSALLSILSCLTIVGADVVVHGDFEPTGVRWEFLKNKYGSRLSFVKIVYAASAYGNSVRDLTSFSDLLRLDILIRYGGLWTDWDAIWLKPPTEEMRSYDAIMNLELYRPRDFPYIFNGGVLIAKKDAEFLHHFQRWMRFYRSQCKDESLCKPWASEFQWLVVHYSPMYTPYKIYECYPWTVHVETHLQVICTERQCHPTWYYPGVRKNKPVDWEKDTFVQHIVDYQPEYTNFTYFIDQLEAMNAGKDVHFAIKNAAKVLKVAGVSFEDIKKLKDTFIRAE